jgi:hypothetical protein
MSPLSRGRGGHRTIALLYHFPLSGCFNADSRGLSEGKPRFAVRGILTIAVEEEYLQDIRSAIGPSSTTQRDHIGDLHRTCPRTP